MAYSFPQEKIDTLIREMPELVRNFKNWWYDEGGGPSLYFYKRTMAETREDDIGNLLDKKSYKELIYATLTAWDMDSRRASMQDFEVFEESIDKNKDLIKSLCNYKLSDLDREDVKTVENHLREIYDNLNLMKSSGKLVATAKFLHFTVPDLIMPMDRSNTLEYFYGNTRDTKSRLIEVFNASWEVSQRTNLEDYVDNDFNLSEPKVIDNAINTYMRD